MAVSAAVRRLVLARADERCEYCRIDAWPLTVDHVVPGVFWHAAASEPSGERAGLATGFDDLDNLAAACSLCHRAKSDATAALDPRTDSAQPLFNPRRHRWSNHFRWVNDCLDIVGTTPIGRATVVQLRLNREPYRRQRSRLRAAMRGGGPPWP